MANQGKPARPGALILGRWRTPFFYGWVIVAVIFFAEFIGGSVGGLTIPLFFKPMSESLGWSLTQLTGAVTAQTLAYVGVAPFLGAILDRFGARPVMTFGAITAGLGLLLLTQVQAVWQFWVLYALVGALGLHEMGGFTGPVVIAKWFVRRRGRAMALSTLGTTLGAGSMAPIIGILIATVGWRQTWGLMGVMILILVVPIVLLFMRREPEDVGLRPDGDPPDEVSTGPQATAREFAANAPPTSDEEVMWTLREALHTRALWVIVLALNLVNLSTSVIVVHLVPFLTLEEGVSAETAGVILTLRLVSASVARLIWGFLVERIPIRVCLAGSFFFRSASTLALIIAPYPWNVVLLLLANIPGGAFAVLQPMAFANYYGRRFAGSIQGAIRPFLTISQLISPLFIAVLFDVTGTFVPAFLIATLMGFAAAGVALLATPPRRPVLPSNVAA